MTSSWTIVTGYFDLTVEPDAGPDLRARQPEYYLEQHSGSVLSLERDLIVFTEARFEEKIWAKRPPHLHNRTQVLTQSFSEFPLFKYRDRIWKNRDGYTCRRDPRNTASFYLVCMAKFAMLERAASINENSSHFAWVDISIEKLGLGNISAIDNALALERDKLSTCRIAYRQPPTDNLADFFRGGCASTDGSLCGVCTFCGTFFTMDRDTLKEACPLAESEFIRALENGYGHVDEQIMALMHGARPDLFDWYIGDYAQCVMNYDLVHENPHAPIVNFILPSIEAQDWTSAKKAVDILWRSYKTGACQLDDWGSARLLQAMQSIEGH